jgi:hypothetical protein
MPTQKGTRRLGIRLYPDRDEDLIAWVDSLPQEYGAVNQAVTDALRRGITPEKKDAINGDVALNLDAEILQGINDIIETLPDKLLPPIRKIVQNVIRRELATVSLADQEEQEVEKIPSIEEALDAMESELVDTSINPRRPS